MKILCHSLSCAAHFQNFIGSFFLLGRLHKGDWGRGCSYFWGLEKPKGVKKSSLATKLGRLDNTSKEEEEED